jgi:hypothetical protein
MAFVRGRTVKMLPAGQGAGINYRVLLPAGAAAARQVK